MDNFLTKLIALICLLLNVSCSSVPQAEPLPAPGLARCEALQLSCGWIWDEVTGEAIDIWEISEDGSEWVVKDEYLCMDPGNSEHGCEDIPDRCVALIAECGYGWDSSTGQHVDRWELSEDGSEWIVKEGLEIPAVARCLGFVESCGFRFDEVSGEYYDFWIWDYGMREFVDHEALILSVP
tara:strand:- start:22 stop:564 length:543 start_codon:yes stop_codon:yes gene_type:complete